MRNLTKAELIKSFLEGVLSCFHFFSVEKVSQQDKSYRFTSYWFKISHYFKLSNFKINDDYGKRN